MFKLPAFLYAQLPGTPQMEVMHPAQIVTLGDVVARHTEDVASDTATAISLAAGTTVIEVTAEDYGVYVRATTAEDTDACTDANFDGYVSAGSTRHYGLSSDATGLSLIGKGGTADITLIEY